MFQLWWLPFIVYLLALTLRGSYNEILLSGKMMKLQWMLIVFVQMYSVSHEKQIYFNWYIIE